MKSLAVVLALALLGCGSESRDPSSVEAPAVQALAPVEGAAPSVADPEEPAAPAPSTPQAPSAPAVAPDAGTPAPTPPKPVPAAPAPAQPPTRWSWGLPVDSPCVEDAQCQSGDTRVTETCAAGACASMPAIDAHPADSYCQTDPYTINYFLSQSVPGPMQEEGLEPEAYATPPGAAAPEACESSELYSELEKDWGRAPGAACDSWAQCQDTDPCTQNACVTTGETSASGKRLGVCRVRAKLDGENRGFIFSDSWAGGKCQDGAATDAGKLHGPCRSDGTCVEGVCSVARFPWARACK